MCRTYPSVNPTTFPALKFSSTFPPTHPSLKNPSALYLDGTELGPLSPTAIALNKVSYSDYLSFYECPFVLICDLNQCCEFQNKNFTGQYQAGKEDYSRMSQQGREIWTQFHPSKGQECFYGWSGQQGRYQRSSGGGSLIGHIPQVELFGIHKCISLLPS